MTPQPNKILQSNLPGLTVGDYVDTTPAPAPGGTGNPLVPNSLASINPNGGNLAGSAAIAAGLAQPNPQALGITLFEPNLDVSMADPPTLGGWSAGNAPSSFAYPQEWKYYPGASSTPNPVWRQFGWPPKNNGPNFYDAFPSALSYTIATPPMFFDINTDAPELEIEIVNAGAGFLVMRVDGEWVVPPSAPLTPPAGASQLVRNLVTFPARQMRHIEFGTTGGLRFVGICTTKADTVAPPSQPLGPRVFWQGNSFPEGVSGRSNRLTAYPYRAGQILGWRDAWYVGVGGTDLINNGGGASGKTTVGARMAQDVYANLHPTRPNIIMLTCTALNDYAVATEAQVTAAMTALLQDIQAHAPNALTIVQGACCQGNSAGAQTNMRDAVLTALQANPTTWGLWIDQLAGTWRTPNGTSGGPGLPWFTGTGRVGATTNDGTADICRAADDTHPTDAGDQINARNLARDIRNGLWNLAQAA